MVQAGGQAHVLHTDVGALQVQISDLRLQRYGLHALLISGGKGVVPEMKSCLFQGSIVT